MPNPQNPACPEISGTPELTESVAASRAAFVAACLGAFVVFLDVSVVNVATTALGHELGGDLTGLEWVINGYALSFGALLLTAGAMSDMLGARRVFRLGFALFALSSLACALAPTLSVLIAARICGGIGGALIIPSALSVVRAAHPDAVRRARAIGIWAAAGGSLALAIGPVVGGLLVDQWGWRSIFLINLPIAALGLWLVRAGDDRAVERRRRSLDLTGQLLAVINLGTLTVAVIEASSLGWSATLVEACLAVFVVTLSAFILVERRSSAPMLPLGLFRNQGFTAATLVSTLINVALYGLVFVLSLFFQRSWAFSAAEAGLAFLPMTASTGLSNIAVGPTIARWGVRTPVIVGILVTVAGLAALLATLGDRFSPVVLLPLIVTGAGVGLAVPSLTVAMLGVTDSAAVGIASGAFNTLRQVGGIVGVAMMGLLAGSASGPSAIRACIIASLAALGVGLVIGLAGVRSSG